MAMKKGAQIVPTIRGPDCWNSYAIFEFRKLNVHNQRWAKFKFELDTYPYERWPAAVDLRISTDKNYNNGNEYIRISELMQIHVATLNSMP